MPRENRKRGKKKKGDGHKEEPARYEAKPELEQEPTHPVWMHTNDETNPDAPFGYVDPDVKAYFRTVDSKIQDWQSQGSTQGEQDDGNTNEDKRMFLVAALSESSGKEKQLATDPDCAIILERMLHSMDDFVKRVFADRLCGSYVQLAQHRFGSHVCQTLFEVSAMTASREARGHVAKPPDVTSDAGILRPMTELVLAACEEILPSLSQLILNPFASHVILSLLLLLSPTITQSTDLSKPNGTLVRSKKSAAYKSRQGSMKSILDASTERSATFTAPASFKEMAVRFVDTLRDALDANEVRALAADKVANPVLQALVELEAKQGKSNSSGSLIDSILMGAVSIIHQKNEPEHSDYIETLLRDPTASHLFETILRHAPEPAFKSLWALYFKSKLSKLSSHPVANFVAGKAILRLDSDALSEAIQEISGAAGKLIKTARTGVLKAIVDRASILESLQDTSSELICQAVGVEDTHINLLVPCLLALKPAKAYMKNTSLAQEEQVDDSPGTSPGDLEPTVQGAVLIQAMLRFSDPHNQVIVRRQALLRLLAPNTYELFSIQAQGIGWILSISRSPVSSRVLDAFLESPSVQTRDKRKFLLELIGHYHSLVDDRIGSRVGDRCWQCADPYLKERIAKSILPHEDALAASYYGKYFARNLHLTMLKRDPAAWRDMQRNQKAASIQAIPSGAEPSPSVATMSPQDAAAERKKKRKRAEDPDEIDVLFSKAPPTGKLASSKNTPTGQPVAPAEIQLESRVADPELGEVLGAIKKVSKKEGMRKGKRL
ncbi:Pumilio-family RNA binding repeat [Ceratobasidium sp. AG-Ba]|nr:Pumilio-family RNA binding repeat [Ceratobasidium sp. AG-Ba]QRW01694.1 Pumilio-family RNA binding repeat [Ceratobasidium sp. AG-Ba]